MRSYLQRMWACRYFWMSLVRMDIRTRYRGSWLGLGWAVLQPIGMTIVLCIVFGKIFHHDLTYFGPYVLSGLACWTFILSAGTKGCGCFHKAESYMRQFPAPIAIYPLRQVLELGFHLLVSIGVVIALTAIVRGLPNPLSLLSLIPSLVLFLVLGWSMAAITGLMTVHFPDTRHLTEVGFRGIFYLTPVMLTDAVIQQIGMKSVYYLNPFGWYLRLLRQPILEGTFPSWKLYGATAATALGAMCVASLALRRLEKRIIFHL